MDLPMADDHITAKRHRVEHVDVYEVFGDELDRIEQEGISVGTDLQFALFWLPIAVTLTTTLSLTNIQNLKIYVGFFIVMVVSYGFGIYFGIRWWRCRGSFKRLLTKIRDRQVGPIGEEGKEVKNLTELPSAEPPAAQ
jgi:hypothetical protein